MKALFKHRSIFILAILSLLVFAIIYFQALIPSWRGHLEIDTWNYYLRVEHFIKYRTFLGAPGVEILPSTSLFLLLPSFISGWHPFTYGSYLSAFFFIVFLGLSLQLWLIRNQPDSKKIIFLLTLLFFGPIILFRFDSLATLIVILSLLLFRQRKFPFSALLLGLATAIKIYPVIILPYLLLILKTKKQNQTILVYLVYFAEALLLSIFPYLLLGGNLSLISEGLEFHALKYVSIESVPGTLLTGLSLITDGRPLPLVGGYGVWGVSSKFIDAVGLAWFNRLWLFPIVGFYLYLYRRPKLAKKLSFATVFFLILLFLIFSKNLHAQYLWWFIPLLPFFTVKAKGQSDYLFIFSLTLIASLLGQNVYPRLYTDFLENFYGLNQAYPIYYLQLLRNLSLIALLIFSFRAFFIKKTIT